jgi:ABC-type transport system involved in cytochrome c biogenesis ATPase subunit
MIIQFSVSNYRCFRGLQTLNLTASGDKSLPENCIDVALPGLSGKRWLKGVGIYGANASGKSTLLDALNALRRLVLRSAKVTDAKERIEGVEPFALCPEQSAPPTGFGIVFVAAGVRYEYRVAATRERIWHESLRAFPSAREQVWYARDWNPESSEYTWTPERPTGFRRDSQLEGYTLRNMLFLSKAVANNREELEPVYDWFKERLRFLDLGTHRSLSHSFTLRQIEERAVHTERIVELLRHADIGVDGAGAVENPPDDETLEKMISRAPEDVREDLRKRKWLRPELTHHGSTSGIPLPWNTESAGTRRLFALAGPWLDILNQGLVVCVDELETSMHPLMVRELLRVFMSSEENPNGAQIVFTTHNPLLLDTTLIRRDQVWFTDKDEAGTGHLYPLTDYSPRRGESLIRGYLSGRYGAVPFIPTGLLGKNRSAEGEGEPIESDHE